MNSYRNEIIALNEIKMDILDWISESGKTEITDSDLTLLDEIMEYYSKSPGGSSLYKLTLDRYISKLRDAVNAVIIASGINDDYPNAINKILESIKKLGNFTFGSSLNISHEDDLKRIQENLKNLPMELDAFISNNNITVATQYLARIKDSLIGINDTLTFNFDRLPDILINEIKNILSLINNDLTKTTNDAVSSFNSTTNLIEILKNNIESQIMQIELKEIIKKATQASEKVKDQEEYIERLYKQLGTVSTITAPQQTARVYRSRADFLFIVALFILLCASGFLALTIITELNTNEFAWFSVLSKIPIAFVMLLPALYLASESKRFRDREERFNDLEIKMLSTAPFFESISDGPSKDNPNVSEKDMAKIELAKMHLAPFQPVHKNDYVLIPKDVVKLFEKICQISPISKS